MKNYFSELDDLKSSSMTGESQIDKLNSDKDDLQAEVQKLKDKLHQFKKKSMEEDIDRAKANESMVLIEDKSKTLEEKLLSASIASEEWQEKFKEAQETLYQHTAEQKQLQEEKTRLENNLSEVTVALETLRSEKDSLLLDLYEQAKYKDEVEILRKEKDRLSEKADTLWKEVKDHQDLVHATEKEHLDLRRELEAQIRDKEAHIQKLQK